MDQQPLVIARLRVVEGQVEISPKLVAEPGVMPRIEGDLLSNLTRAAYDDPRVVARVVDPGPRSESMAR